MARIKYFQALQNAIQSEMERDENVVLFGEDVGESGGIFSQTRGLYKQFGSRRVRDTPIAENGFVSAAVGAAMTGLRPIVEVGFEDFLTACMDPLVNQAAKLRFMLGGQVTVPMVVYTFGGGGLNAGPQHSQSFVSWFSQVPGLKVVLPATPADVFSMTKAAVRDDNPVIVLLSKKLIGSSGEVDTDKNNFDIDLESAYVTDQGDDVTLVAFGAMVIAAIDARSKLAEIGCNAEVVNGCCANPYDIATIKTSVKKTGRLAVVHEAHLPCGPGAEIIASLVEEDTSIFKLPPIRITPPFAPSPFAPNLEREYLPSGESIFRSISSMLNRHS